MSKRPSLHANARHSRLSRPTYASPHHGIETDYGPAGPSAPAVRVRPLQGKRNCFSRPCTAADSQAVVTPVVFVSFILSLAWVEFRYSVLRSHSHAGRDSNSNCLHAWMPAWLHRLVYRRQGHQYVVVRGSDGNGNSDSHANNNQQTYYHSMQRKLLKMEADEAFRIRSTVLAVMAGVAAVVLWCAMAGVRWLSRGVDT